MIRFISAFASELNSITIDDGARAEIQQALAEGYEVTVHQSPVSVPGWTGSGYSIIDSDIGVGAYKIFGGASGGKANIGPEGIALGLAAAMGALIDSLLSVFVMQTHAGSVKPSGVVADALLGLLSARGESGGEIIAKVVLAILAGLLMAAILDLLFLGLIASGLATAKAALVAKYTGFLVTTFSAAHFFATDR